MIKEMGKFKVGDKVTCKETVKAYYSEYHPLYPKCEFIPGMIGIIGDIVYPPNGWFCVDFEGPEYGTPQHRYKKWRCALKDDNIIKIKEKKISS